MRIIIGNQYYPTPEGSSISITNSMSDPVPTATLNLIDNTSSISIPSMSEILVIDDQVIPNPTVNMLQNPALIGATGSQYAVINPTTSVTIGGTNPGNSFSLGAGTTGQAYLRQAASAIVGQAYIFSAYMDITAAFTAGSAFIEILFLDAASNALASGQQTLTTTTPVGSTVRVSVQSTAPANAAYVQIRFGVNVTSTTSSGSVTFTQLQLEPIWFPTLAYPTPWCGPSQINCQQLPLGLWIRQYRKFAGFVNHTVNQDYVGNKRTVVVNAVGYAWIASLILGNDSFTSKTDAQVITSLLSKYFLSNGTALCTTTNVITGTTLSDVQLNWDDMRTVFDNLCSQSGFYWTIDFYWNFVYAPPGYFSQPISLICDNSATINNVTTFPAYNFSAETDFTQPGSNILCIGGTSGSTTFDAQVIDPEVIAQIGITSGYTLPVTTSWMRKVTDNAIMSNADCTQRGMAELIQYDNPRKIYHLSANVELKAGYGIAVTSNTDGLSASTELIQQVQAQWLGTNELLQDEWEYQADLGAVNRAATNMISRIFRATTAGSSAPAISGVTLAVLEYIGIVDGQPGQGTIISNYAQTILADTPVAYYRLAELTGTIADDISGNAQQGTLNGGITQRTATLLADAADMSDLSMTFNGTSGYIALPSSGTWPTGNSAWTLECWCKPANATNTNDAQIITIGQPGTNGKQAVICQTSSGGWGVKTWGGTGHDFNGNGTSIAGTIYYLAATYDGASHINLYVGVGGTITVYGPFNCGTLSLAVSAHQRIGDTNVGTGETFFFPGVIDEPAIYMYALSAAQINTHYNTGL